MKIWDTHVPNRCESLLVHVSTATSPRQPSELVYYSWQLPSVIGLELAPERQSRAQSIHPFLRLHIVVLEESRVKGVALRSTAPKQKT